MKNYKVKSVRNVFNKDIFEVSKLVLRVIDKSNWVQGIYLGMNFEAKIYTESSDYGINGGRVSKLAIMEPVTQFNSEKRTVVNYDRGWDFGQNGEFFWVPIVDRLEVFAASKQFKKLLGVVGA